MGQNKNNNSSLILTTFSLYSSLKEDRERVKANYEAGLIDLDGMMGKMGSISLATVKAKFSSHDTEYDPSKNYRNKKVVEENPSQGRKEVGHLSTLARILIFLIFNS